MEDVQNNKVKRSIKSTFAGIFYKLIGIICPFIIRTIIIYSLGREYLGLSSLFTSILQILSLTELGIGSAMVFSLYKPVDEKNYCEIAKIMSFFKNVYRFIGIVITVFGLMVLPFLSYLISGDVPDNINIYILYIIYLLNTCISYFFFAYRISLLNAYQRADLVSNASSISSIFLYSFQIIFLIFFKNYYTYAICLPLATLFNNLLIYIFSRKYFIKLKEYSTEKGSFEENKDSLNRIKPLFGHKLGAVLICSMDNIVISSLLGLIQLSIFNNYYYVITAINVFIDIVLASILYGVGNYIINHNADENYTLYINLNYAQGMIVSFCSICMLTLYQDFINLWVGSENLYQEFYIVILFVIYFYSWKFRSVGLTFKDAAGLWKNDWLKPYVGVIINIALDFLLVHFIGAPGALISTIVIFMFLYYPWETRVLFKDLFKRSCKKYVFKNLLYLLITITLGVLVYYFVNRFIIVSDYGDFILKTLIVVSITSISLILCTFWTSEFKYFKNKFGRIIKHSKTEEK